MRLLSTLTLLCLLPIAVLGIEDYYKLLGLERNADDRQIKKAYRSLSKKYHPDKNPNDDSAHQKFVDVAEAYDVLIDPEIRLIYDQHGYEAVKKHKAKMSGPGGGMHNPFDLFSRFFGGGGHFHSGQRKGPNMEFRIGIPLHDFYVGETHEFTTEKQVICPTCAGSGSEDGQRETCPKCQGQGMVLQKHMLAPGIFQQMQMQCDQCGGKGSTAKHKCKVCGGDRVIRQNESFSVDVEKGMLRGTSVTFENEADESPDWAAGDVIVHLHEAEPQLETQDELRVDGVFFRRKEKDLFWREVLSLREAWMGGWTRNLTHLDGHIVPLSRQRGQVVQPGAVEVIPGEGMPVWRHEGGGPTHGSLHIEYVVILPDQMEKSAEKEFFDLWEKYRKKKGVDLRADSGRPRHDEL